MLHFFVSDKARNIWWAYALTALRFSPTSLPNRLTTSRKFMLEIRKSSQHLFGMLARKDSEAHLKLSNTKHR